MERYNSCNKFRKDNKINGNTGNIIQHGMIFLVVHALIVCEYIKSNRILLKSMCVIMIYIGLYRPIEYILYPTYRPPSMSRVPFQESTMAKGDCCMKSL